ncbi:MAG: hypothetical protein JXR72_05675 [Proteobacteria bacterium]|nr:hypothetical protein [Pseudomonadota bacterium]
MDGKEDRNEKNAEKDTRKIISDDVETFFRDVWGKVVEYASMGAEEATKLSSTAKTRVDVETLKFKKGKVIKMLGERYLELCEKTPSAALPGTKEILKTLQGIDKEIKTLEQELSKGKKPAKKKKAKKALTTTPAGKKAAAEKTAASKKAPSRKKSPSVKKTPAAKKPAPAIGEREKSPATGGILAPSTSRTPPKKGE